MQEEDKKEILAEVSMNGGDLETVGLLELLGGEAEGVITLRGGARGQDQASSI